MKTCSICGSDLPEPIFEYGDAKNPTCFHCFIDPPINEKIELEIHDLEENNRELEEEISDLEDQIFDLEEEIRSNRHKIEALRKNKLRWKIVNQEKVTAWVAGEPIKAVDQPVSWGYK